MNKNITKSELTKHFSDIYLKNTCFSSLDELLKDNTNVFVNAPRALIAVELKGVWRGLQEFLEVK